MYVPDQLQDRYHPFIPNALPTDVPPTHYTYGLSSRHIVCEMMDTPEEAEEVREYAAMVGRRREYLKCERQALIRPATITDLEGFKDDFRKAIKLASVEMEYANVMRKEGVGSCFVLIEGCDAE